jgi:outer membrane protein insertion porin family
VVVNVDVEENSTGDFSIMGGYSTSDGWLGEVSVQERNLLGTGRFARAAVTYGQYTKGIELSYAEPYFLDYRASLGIDLFAKQTLSNTYISYGTESFGGTLKWSLPLREDLAVQLRYSAFSQSIQLPSTLNNCNNINPDFVNTFPTNSALASTGDPASAYPGVNGPGGPSYANNLANGQVSCLADGEASLPVRAELANGATFTSAPGYGIVYNSLDNNKNPTNGVYFIFGQDIAGAGGDTAYIKSTMDFRTYYEVVSDLVGIVHLQGGTMSGFNNCPSNAVCANGTGGGYVRMLDDFKMGPNLVRGFEPAGLGPRDITFGTTDDNIGGTHFWGASLEFQYPFYFLPKDSGFRGAVFADAGSVWGYKGETQLLTTGEVNGPVTTNGGPPGSPFNCQCGMPYSDGMFIRSSVGASLIWDSPFGPLRFDFAYPITKGAYDRTQWFAFGGGAKF